jgi:hypothetical protein
MTACASLPRPGRGDQGDGASVPPDLADAWFELVEFPIRISAAANMRFFAAERYNELIDSDQAMARSAGGAAVDAQAEITALTDRFNNGTIAGGKWRWLMPEEPADSQWRIYRARLDPSAGRRPDRRSGAVPGRGRRRNAPAASPVFEAEAFTANTGWRLVDGVGRGRGVMLADAPGATLTLNVDVAGSDGRRAAVGRAADLPRRPGPARSSWTSASTAARPERVGLPRKPSAPRPGPKGCWTTC